MPARTLKATIALDGEAAFRRDMQSVNNNLRALKAEVKATESAFLSQGKSLDTLRQHQKTLQDAYEQSKQKVAALEQAVRESTVRYGENSTYTDRLRTSLGNARAEMNGFDAAVQKATRELEEAENAERETASGMEELGDSTEDAARQMGTMDIALGNLMANMAQRGLGLLKDMGKLGIEYNAQIESYTKAMTTALGSAEAAAEAISNIKMDAAVTPYAVDSLVRANQLLIAAGESADDARSTVMALSDAVSATGGGNDELMRMAQNLQQIKNVGKATAMDIKQFQMAGIDVYGILAEYTGLAIEDASQLTVTYELLSQALQTAAAEGGRYFGANTAQAASLNGQVSTLKDNIKSKLGEALEGVSGTLSGKFLPQVNEFIAGLDVEEVLAGFEDLINVAGAVGGAIAMVKAAEKIDAWVTAANTAVMEFGQAAISITTVEGGLELMNGRLTVSQLLYGVLSGQIEGATVKQLALNAAAGMFPGAILVAAITAVAIACKKANDEGKKLREELTASYEADAMASESVDEVTAALERLTERQNELRQQISAEGGYRNAPQDLMIEYEALGDSIEHVTAHLEDLQAEEEAARLEAERQQAYLESTAGKIETVTGQLEELKEAYNKAYQAAYDSMIGQFDLYDQVEPVVAGSTEDIIKALESQAEYYSGYADNLATLRGLTVEGIGLNADLVNSLSDGSSKSVQAAATIAQGYEEALANGGEAAAAYVENLNTAFEAQREAAQQAAEEMVRDQQEQIEELESELAELTEKLNQEEAAKDAAESTLEGFIEGVASKIEEISSTMSDAGAQALESFQAGLNSGSISLPPISFSGPRIGRIDGSHASGLDYVPYDGYIAELHKREMIVPAPAADLIRAGGFGGKTEINIYPQEMSQSVMDYAFAAFVERAGDAI